MILSVNRRLFRHLRQKFIPNKIKSFLLVYEAAKTTTNNQVGGGSIWEGSFGCEFFYVDRCVLREWVVRGGGLDGYFGDLR